jgi:hypothetical protein
MPTTRLRSPSSPIEETQKLIKTERVPVNLRQTLDEQLRFAIAYKRLVQLSYHGRQRVAEPHDYGVQKGVTKLLIYQLQLSGTRSKDVTGWRLLDASKIEVYSVLEETFPGSRGQSHARHHLWDVLYARVM